MPRVAIRFHRSRRRFVHHPEVMKEMKRVHDKVIKPKFVKEFDKVVANWRNKPRFFSARKRLGEDAFVLYVYPVGSELQKNIWRWNVEGTRPHVIAARNAPRLAFMWGGPGSYLPKTGPGGKWYGGPGSVVGGEWHFPLAVMHPGTAAREWPKVIGEKLSGFYRKEVEAAWRRALRRINSK